MLCAVLQEAMVGSVDNGRAYGVCRCGGTEDEREDAPLCKVEEGDPQAMTITCQDGYYLKVRKPFPHLIPPAHATTSWLSCIETPTNIYYGMAHCMEGLLRV